jgi:o-succinylbenzoate synthase
MIVSTEEIKTSLNRYSASYRPFPLQFKKPAGTSRGYLHTKPSWILTIRDHERNTEGNGECSIIPGLSIDPENKIENILQGVCFEINQTNELKISEDLFENFPAMKFAYETAVLDLKGGGRNILFDNLFSKGQAGIPINGLVWMADTDDMYRQAIEKAESGFKCLKFKIGALDFDSELKLLERIRNRCGPEIEIRLDANGAFLIDEVMQKLESLSRFQIHSIEQPIKAGNCDAMEKVCAESPIPVALDEELIGITGKKQKQQLVQHIKPQYLILKPSLLGGLAESDEWIEIAEQDNADWWATSALESNLGLNAIAQWVADKNPLIPQGLGTGGLYVANYPLNLKIKSGELWFSAK